MLDRYGESVADERAKAAHRRPDSGTSCRGDRWQLIQVLGDATRDALLRGADGLSPGLVVASEFAAAGKSSVSRWLALQFGALVMDKDSFAPALEQAVMSELTGNPQGAGVFSGLIRDQPGL
ncbi:hypothetical protein [Nocardia sp. NPDC046763]|uniref:hypothetical protein n=1 Tax=Nocardia sp. NPDC046763 TaxID=3155256 RepID=UPI0033C98BA0